jgi:hypothetical protein
MVEEGHEIRRTKKIKGAKRMASIEGSVPMPDMIQNFDSDRKVVKFIRIHP